VFLAQIHNPAVDLHHVEVCHPWVAQAFPGGSPITAADHQHAFDGLGRAERRMHQCFVVVAFLVFCRHPAAIQ
jgi:hypothetical protein